MIPDYKNALKNAIDHLSPGGTLGIIDFAQGQGLPKWFEKIHGKWLRKFHVTPRTDLVELIHGVCEHDGGQYFHKYLNFGYAILILYKKRHV